MRFAVSVGTGGGGGATGDIRPDGTGVLCEQGSCSVVCMYCIEERIRSYSVVIVVCVEYRVE